ncbi:uncharacterized protein LOC106143151 [Amyelois transitella]|uniref:uncharacterized protein LOC106143151 n=1 Tax=Amyelois transitella TaxID=680683 RepID=UPI00067BADE7|nr:uncharacterized protein LOC106143151 [Amyelois transitella]
MVTCELDNDVSGEVLGWKLPAWQALLLHRVLPSCGGLVIYITLICFDLALINEHFANGHNVVGSFCIILMVLPAVISLVFTLASPPPGLQTEMSAYSVNLQKKDVKWVLLQICNCLFFPVAAVGRYCYLIFWWIEAVFASRADDDQRAQEAVNYARKPSPVELYLFLQSFVHAAPHALVNILDIMARYQNPVFGKAVLQSISIIASSLRMASTATIYRRFEREKLNGRRYPWSNPREEIDNANNENLETAIDGIDEDRQQNEEPIYETIDNFVSASSHRTSYRKSRQTSDLMQFSPTPRTINESTFYYDYDDVSTESNSSGYIPPFESMRSSPEVNSDEEYVRPISIIDRVAPRRRDTQYTIQEVYIPPPPQIPAPRPGSFAVWAEKMVENAESIPMWLSAPPRRKYCDEVVQDEPDIPVRVPRAYMRGLEPQDLTAALVHFLAWYSFFVSRLLSIAVFINLSIIASTIVLFSHYQVMLLFLIVPQASTVKRSFYLFLAFVYLFCLMEFKIRFRHVRVWHVFWIIVVTIETIVFTGLWFGVNNNLHFWWRQYVVYVIIMSMLLSYMCFVAYFVLLKPKETIVYLKNRNKM